MAPILEEMIWRLSDIVVGRPTQAEATNAVGAHKARLDRISARGQSAVWPVRGQHQRGSRVERTRQVCS